MGYITMVMAILKIIQEYGDDVQDLVAVLRNGDIKPASEKFAENRGQLEETQNAIDAWRKAHPPDEPDPAPAPPPEEPT